MTEDENNEVDDTEPAEGQPVSAFDAEEVTSEQLLRQSFFGATIEIRFLGGPAGIEPATIGLKGCRPYGPMYRVAPASEKSPNVRASARQVSWSRADAFR